MKKAYLKLFLVILISTILIGTKMPIAQGKININSKVINYNIGKDVEIKGVFGGYTFFFYVDKNWQVSNSSYIEVLFNRSEVIDFKKSSITIYLNDYPIKSIPLFNQKTHENMVKIMLPKNKINYGYNSIRIKTFHKLFNQKEDEICTDNINPANWIVLDKSSYIHLEYNEKIDSLSIREYPYPYLKVGSNKPVDCIIALPDNLTSKKITAAMIVSTDFGRKERFKNLEVKLMKFSDMNSENIKNNIIFLGSSSDLPNAFSSFLSSKEKNEIKNKALIKKVISPFNPSKKLLLILSDDENMITNAVKSISEDYLAVQMKDSFQYIDSFLPKNIESNENLSDITMKDLEYSDVEVKGLFYQQTIYNINIPKDRKIKGEAYANFFIRYSNMLNFDKASLTIYINGVPVQDKQLSSAKANGDNIIVKIPDEFKNKGSLEVKLVFYLEPKNFKCDIKAGGNLWVVISNKSGFTLPYESINSRYLENYPSPFIKDGKFNNVIMVIPDNPSSYYLNLTANMVAFLGHSVKNFDDFKVVESKDFNEKSGNIMVIGTPLNNKIIRDINDKLYIKFDNSFLKFVSNQKLPLLNSFSKDSALIQITSSPWDSKSSILSILSLNDKTSGYGQNFFRSFELVQKLKGDAAVVDEIGNIQFAYYDKSGLEKEKANTNKNIIGNIEYSSNNGENNTKSIEISIFVGVLITIITASIVIIVKRNKEGKF